MNSKYSIIVPAYNVSEYIIDCLESIYRLNYDRNCYEVIVINDGSTDETPQLIEDWIKDKSNYRFISQENKGLGGARNTGIEFSKGEWLIFIDSDDWFHDPELLNIFDTYQKDNDIELIKSISYRETSVRDVSETYLNKDSFIDSGAGTEILVSENFKPHVWLGCYKSTLIKRSEYKFREKIAYEDLDWSIVMHLNARKAIIINYPFYSYFYNTSSLSNNKSLKRIRDLVASLLAVKSIISAKTIPHSVSDVLKRRLKKNTIRLVFITRNYKILDSVKIFKEANTLALFDTILYNSSTKERLIHYIYLHFPLWPITAIRSATLFKRMCLKMKRILQLTIL